MVTINLNFDKWWRGWQYTSPGKYDEKEIIENNIEITSGGKVYNACSSTKLSFITPPFLSSSHKITLKLTAKGTSENSVCNMILSESNYTSTGSVMSPSNFQCNYVAEALKSTSIKSVQRIISDGIVTFTLEDIQLKPNTSYYLYFLRTGASGYYFSEAMQQQGYPSYKVYTSPFTATEPQLSITIPDLEKLDYPEINTDFNIYSYNSSLTINWEKVDSKIETNSSIANPLKEYRVFLREDAAPNEQVYDKVYNTTNLYQTFSLAGIARGKNIYIGIMAISTYDTYKNNYPDYLKNCNSELFIFKKGQINNLPTVSIKESSTSIGGDTAAIFNLVYSDNDSQKLSGYFTLNGNVKKPIDGNSLTISLDQLRNDYNITETGEYSIQFYAYDGLEYSDSLVEATIYAEFAPIIETSEYILNSIKDGYENNQSQEYVDLIKSTFQLKNDVISGLTARVVIKLLNTEQIVSVPEDCYKLEILNLQKTISINITKIPESILSYGEQFSLNYEIINKDNLTSGQVGWTSACYRPYKRLVTPEVVIENDATIKNDLWKLNFNRALTFDFILPEAQLGYPDIAFFNLKIKADENTFEQIVLGKDEGQRYSINTELFDYVSKNSKFIFSFELIDSSNQKIESKLYEYWRIGTVSYPINSYGKIIPSTFNPNLDMNGILITHPTAINETNSQIEIQYEYKCQLGEGSFSFNTILEDSSESNTITVCPSSLFGFNQRIFRIVGENSNFTGPASILITAIDAFGQESIFTISSFNINLITPPTFVEETFSIYRDLNTNPSNYIDRKDTFEKVLAGTIFNMGEGIVFEIPKPVDPNNDLTRFDIYLFRSRLIINEYNQPMVPLYSEIADSFPKDAWVSIDINKCESTDNYYYYRYSASSYKENEFFYFKVIAIDSYGNASKNYEQTRLTGLSTPSYGQIYEPNYIIGARVAPSKIEITPTETKINENSVTLKFNLKINDLGGSALSKNNQVVWDENYYALFNNLERQTGTNWDMKLRIEISPYQDFSKEVKYTDLVYSSLYKFTYENQFVQINNYSENTVRVYVRMTLAVSYSLEDGQLVYIMGTPFTYSHFDIAPTVSHRPHRVGINTANMDNEENQDTVLRIDSYSNYNKIKLESGSNLIEINLELGTITGAIIDGGTW